MKEITADEYLTRPKYWCMYGEMYGLSVRGGSLTFDILPLAPDEVAAKAARHPARADMYLNVVGTHLLDTGDEVDHAVRRRLLREARR